MYGRVECRHQVLVVEGEAEQTRTVGNKAEKHPFVYSASFYLTAHL